MAERGIFTMAELGRRMADRGNYPLTAPALHRLAGGKDGQPPKEIRLATLNALLDALNFLPRISACFGMSHRLIRIALYSRWSSTATCGLAVSGVQLESQGRDGRFVAFLLLTMANKKYMFTCPACTQTKDTVVCKGLCSGCAQRLAKRVFTCPGCAETRLTKVMRGLCSRCYADQTKRLFMCPVCRETRMTHILLEMCERCYEHRPQRSRRQRTKVATGRAGIATRRAAHSSLAGCARHATGTGWNGNPSDAQAVGK
jgi:hypothetical protein